MARRKAEERLELHMIALAMLLPALPYLFVVGELQRKGYTRKAKEFRLFALLGLVALVVVILLLKR